VGGAIALVAALGAGLTEAANASGGGSTTNVSFVSLSTPHKLLTNKAFTANASDSVVVIGGTTTVPSNATTVQLSVEAGGTTAGTLNFNPTGNLAGGSGQSLSWSAGGSDTQSIEENVGLSDELTFALSGGAAKVSATIIGYSTQVTDGDISPADGTTGQVLTNNGDGATWQDPGGGPGFGGQSTSSFPVNSSGLTEVALVNVPAGAYDLSFTGDAYDYGSNPDNVECYVYSPSGDVIAYAGTSLVAGGDNELATAVVDSTSGGTFNVSCFDDNGLGQTDVGYDNWPTLNAISLSSAGGIVQNVQRNDTRTVPPGVSALNGPQAG
jgi:hypothetical protein